MRYLISPSPNVDVVYREHRRHSVYTKQHLSQFSCVYLFNNLLVIYLGFSGRAEADPDWRKRPRKRRATKKTAAYERRLRKAAQKDQLAGDNHINVQII